jgi:hypothetical protein
MRIPTMLAPGLARQARLDVGHGAQVGGGDLLAAQRAASIVAALKSFEGAEETPGPVSETRGGQADPLALLDHLGGIEQLAGRPASSESCRYGPGVP